MPKNNSQKGAIEISTIAAIIITAAVVAAVSVIAMTKYYENLNISAPVAVITPKSTAVDNKYNAPTLKQLLNSSSEFNAIFSEVIKANPKLSVDNFSIGKSVPIGDQYRDDSSYYGSLSGYEIDLPKESDPDWVFSPDGKKAINPTFFTQEDFADFYIYNRLGDNKQETLVFGGTSSSYWGSLWLDNEQFIFFQGLENSDKWVISISLFDLSANMKTIYNSIDLDDVYGIQTDDSKRRSFESCMKWYPNSETDCDYLKK